MSNTDSQRLDAMRRQRDGYRNQLRKAEQQIQRVREVAAEYRPSIPEEVLHSVMGDILRALDGDGRGWNRASSHG